MRRHLLIALTIAAALLVVFGLVELLGLGLLTDPSGTLERGGFAIALLAVGLLAADVVLPVPSSIVMVSLGAVYGLLGGAALATVGSLLAAGIAFLVGRRAGGALDRIVDPDERDAFARWFAVRGDLAIILSRPIPIVAETVAGLAGTTTMRPRRFLAVALLGTLPAALLYAAAGAAIADVDNGLLVVLVVLAVATGFWAIGFAVRRRVVARDAARPAMSP